jgi:hypothetical protein
MAAFEETQIEDSAQDSQGLLSAAVAAWEETQIEESPSDSQPLSPGEGLHPYAYAEFPAFEETQIEESPADAQPPGDGLHPDAYAAMEISPESPRGGTSTPVAEPPVVAADLGSTVAIFRGCPSSQGSENDEFTPVHTDPFLSIDMGNAQHPLLDELTMMSAENPDQEFADIDQVLHQAKTGGAPPDLPLTDPYAEPGSIEDGQTASDKEQLAITLYAEHHGKPMHEVMLEEVVQSAPLICLLMCSSFVSK